MKKTLFIALVFSAIIYSCGSGESNTSTEQTPEEKQLAEGKGIRHFTNVNVGPIDPVLQKKRNGFVSIEMYSLPPFNN